MSVPISADCIGKRNYSGFGIVFLESRDRIQLSKNKGVKGMKEERKKLNMMKQYRKGKLWWSAVCLTILAALSTPYTTGTYSVFFWLIESKRLELLLPFVGLYVVGHFVLAGIDKARVNATNRYQAKVLTEIKLSCVKDAIAGGKDSAEVISFLDNDLKLVMDQYFGNIFQLVTRVSIVVFTLCLTMTSNWIFALVYLVLGMLPMKLTGYLAGKIGQKTSQYTDSVMQTTSLVKDLVRNKETLRNYNRIGAAMQRMEEQIFQSETSLAERNNQMAYTNVFMNMVYTVVNILPIAIGIYMGMKGYLSVSAFVAVQYSSGWIVGSLGALAGLISGIKSTRPICDKVLAFGDWIPEDAEKCEDVQSVEFENVDFAYTSEKQVLKKLSFQVKPGSKFLIQGVSGSGKSSILKLICGVLKPNKGKVLLNGKEELSGRKIGFVSQRPAIFADTLRYNLTLGAYFPETKIHDAVVQAGLSEFVAEKGLDYMLEDEGSNLSGGQRQRVEIARALLYDCSLLLVDEGTSALDEDTAAKIHETIMNLDKTVIEVAHYIPEKVKSQFDMVLKLG